MGERKTCASEVNALNIFWQVASHLPVPAGRERLCHFYEVLSHIMYKQVSLLSPSKAFQRAQGVPCQWDLEEWHCMGSPCPLIQHCLQKICAGLECIEKNLVIVRIHLSRGRMHDVAFSGFRGGMPEVVLSDFMSGARMWGAEG